MGTGYLYLKEANGQWTIARPYPIIENRVIYAVQNALNERGIKIDRSRIETENTSDGATIIKYGKQLEYYIYK